MIQRLVARVSGPDAVERVRAALIGVYEADPRFAAVDDPRRAWITWRLRPADGGVYLVSSDVDLLQDAGVGGDLGSALGAAVDPAGAADRALDAVSRGELPDLADLEALDDDPEPPDVPRPDDVVVAIGSRPSQGGVGSLVRSRVSRGERFPIDAVCGAHIRKWIDLQAYGGPVPSFRVRVTGAIVELVRFEKAEVRFVGRSSLPVEATITPDAWELSVASLDLPDKGRAELHLALQPTTLGKGTGVMRFETDTDAFELGVDVKITPR